MSIEFILYVADQSRSARFYAELLGLAPSLDVPGMTEFTLPGGCKLGLMPEAGIARHQKVDMVAVLHRHIGLIGRLFHPSTAKELSRSIDLPLLVMEYTDK